MSASQWALSLLGSDHRVRCAGVRRQFLAWVERAGYQHLQDIEPIAVASYADGGQVLFDCGWRSLALNWAVIGARVQFEVTI